MVFIVLPTYNESKNLPTLISRLFDLPLPLQVLVVDDNSPDGTGAIANLIAAQYGGRVRVLHRERKAGLGPAYLAGLRIAIDSGADLIAQMDADLSHDPDFLTSMVRKAKDSDLVLGSRYIAGAVLRYPGPRIARRYLALAIFMPVLFWGCPSMTSRPASGCGGPRPWPVCHSTRSKPTAMPF